MYTESFGLIRDPFGDLVTSDDYFPTPDHDAALAAMLEATATRGIVVVTGEAGCGKSTIARVLFGRLPAEARIVAVSAETLRDDPIGALDGVRMTAATVVVMDDAHVLSTPALDTCVERVTQGSPRPALVLIGRPALLPALDRSEAQRVSTRAARRVRIGRLSREQTAAYVRHRVAAAGARHGELFNRAALEAVHDLSGGVPARINRLCGDALRAAYRAGARTITPAIVVDCVAAGEAVAPRVARRAEVGAVPTALVAASAGAGELRGSMLAPVERVVERARRLNEDVRSGARDRGDDEAQRAAEERIGRLLAGCDERIVRLTAMLERFDARLRETEEARGRLAEANAAAEERLAQVMQQTARVGQLVGIVRKLYGAIDTRVEELRRRLDAIDRGRQDVPRTIEALRGALRVHRGVAAAPGNATPSPQRLAEALRKNEQLNRWLGATAAALETNKST